MAIGPRAWIDSSNLAGAPECTSVTQLAAIAVEAAEVTESEAPAAVGPADFEPWAFESKVTWRGISAAAHADSRLANEKYVQPSLPRSGKPSAVWSYGNRDHCD